MKAIQDEHTPGPWGVAPNGKQVLAPHVIQRDNVLVRKLSGATPEQVEANARLIVAARNAAFRANAKNPIAAAEALPELLEVLKELEALRKMPHPSGDLNAAVAYRQ
ncbi:hypothetical protein LCGC14_2623480, partial [marine sediment metagenome]